MAEKGRGAPDGRKKNTCWAPCCWASISCSCCTIFASSSRERARGRPTRRAEVVTIQTTFPTTLPVFFMKVVVFEMDPAMDCLVVGGTMSTRAERRS